MMTLKQIIFLILWLAVLVGVVIRIWRARGRRS